MATNRLKRLWAVITGIDPAYVALVLGVLILGGTNFSLMTERSQMRRLLREANPGLTGPKEIMPGDLVPPFVGVTTKGRREALRFDGPARHLLLIYDPRCAVCASESGLWKRLAAEAKAAGVVVKWVSLAPEDLTVKGLERDEVEEEAVIMPDFGTQRAYRVASVPQVLVVQSAGRVEWAHHGAMPEDVQADLRGVLRSETQR